MEATIFLVISFAMLILIYRAIIKISGFLSLDFLSFWFYVYIIFAFLGACVIILGLGDEGYFVIPIAAKENVIIVGSYFVLYGGIATFLSFIALIKVLNTKNRYIKMLTTTCDPKHKEQNTLLVLLVLFLLIFIYYQVSIFPSPLIMAFTNNGAEQIALRRIEVTKDLGLISNTYIISIGSLLAYILPYSYLAFSSIKRKYYFHTFISFFIAIIFILSTGEKGPFLFFILGALVTYSYSRGYVNKISLRLMLVSILLLFSIYYLFVSNDIELVLSLIFDRIFIAQVISVYLSYDYYSCLGDIGYSSFANIITKIFDIKTVAPASEQLMANYFPEMIALGGWNVNGLFISEAWANYGIIGVILSPFLVGLENAVLISVLARFNKSPIQCAFYAFFTIKCAYFLTSFNAYLYHSDWIVTAIVLSLILFLNLIFKQKC